MGPNQTYKLLYSKANHKQNEETTYRLGENIYKQCDWQGLYANSLYNNKNNPIKKQAENLNSRFSKKTYRWQIGTWKGTQHG